jgi:hypothetical protein
MSATISAIADAIRWAEEIMAEIDRRNRATEPAFKDAEKA